MERIIGSVLGHAIGSASGYPGKGEVREVLYQRPIKKYKNSGLLNRTTGCWAEDTALTLATMDSFIDQGVFNGYDILDKFEDWRDSGEYTSRGNAFDVSDTMDQVLANYKSGKKPTECGIKEDDTTAIGRMLPLAIYNHYKKVDQKTLYQLVDKMASLTNDNDLSKLGCYIYVNYIDRLLDGQEPKEAYKAIKSDDYSMIKPAVLKEYESVLIDDCRKANMDNIQTDEDDSTLTALKVAIWMSNDVQLFRIAVIASANLGGDTDTLSALAGSAFGADDNGVKKIPEDMRYGLVGNNYVEELTKEYIAAVKTKKKTTTTSGKTK